MDEIVVTCPEVADQSEKPNWVGVPGDPDLDHITSSLFELPSQFAVAFQVRDGDIPTIIYEPP